MNQPKDEPEVERAATRQALKKMMERIRELDLPDAKEVLGEAVVESMRKGTRFERSMIIAVTTVLSLIREDKRLLEETSELIFDLFYCVADEYAAANVEMVRKIAHDTFELAIQREKLDKNKDAAIYFMTGFYILDKSCVTCIEQSRQAADKLKLKLLNQTIDEFASQKEDEK